MDEILKFFGIFSASTIVVFAILKYTSQKIFESFLKKSIETHKSELERINISHQIQFASLHRERANVIKNLYFKLYNYEVAVLHFFPAELSDKYPLEDLQKRIDEWGNAVLSFSEYFHGNRIYFDSQLCSLLDNINNELNTINSDSKEFISLFDSAADQINAIKNMSPEFKKLKDESLSLLEQKILPVSGRLEKEFRKFLGLNLSIYVNRFRLFFKFHFLSLRSFE